MSLATPINHAAIVTNQWQQEIVPDMNEIGQSTAWGHEGLRYEYSGMDDTTSGLAPRDEVLESMLFAIESRPTKGINFAKYDGIHVDLEVTNDIHSSFKPIKTFAEAELHPAMQLNISLCGYTAPTPIQAYSIPCLLAGNDLLAGAQTGSGKTAAFLIPIISKLMGKAKKIQQPRKLPLQRVEPLVLIIAPTRELATQIFDECRRYCYRSMLRPCVVYGGAHLKSQMDELQRGCDILVASPGRLQDFQRRGTIALSRVRFVVLDEADRMLAMSPEVVRTVLSSSDLPSDDSLQICMYSATFPRQVRELAKDFLSDYFVNIRVGRLGSTTTDITQRVEFVEHNDKQEHLLQLLLDQPPTRTVIFVNSKRQCDTLDDFLYNNKLPVTSIHGDRTQREREDAIASFRNGINPILVATDVAARGIDIKGVMHVVNYDCPFTVEEYVHRIGRTARIGNMGLATTFYNEDSRELAPSLVKLLLENDQSVADFLEEYLPAGPLSFDDSESEIKSKLDDDDW